MRRLKHFLTSEQYLQHVLTHWKKWGEINGGLRKAIEDLLTENARLRRLLAQQNQNS